MIVHLLIYLVSKYSLNIDYVSGSILYHKKGNN